MKRTEKLTVHAKTITRIVNDVFKDFRLDLTVAPSSYNYQLTNREVRVEYEIEDQTLAVQVPEALLEIETQALAQCVASQLVQHMDKLFELVGQKPPQSPS